MVNRLNKACKFFPCHMGLEDCTFCYCPFYPCQNEKLGRFVTAKDERKVWSCEDCNLVHTKKFVDKIFSMIRSDNIKKQFAAGKLRTKNTGVIVLGHGSKIGKANDLLRTLAREIKIESGLDIVEPAFLQLCQPVLQATIKKLVKAGCKKIVIVPFFLFEGNHVTRDIPKVIGQEAMAHKEIEIVYTRNLGGDPRINNIVMDCIRGALA